MDEPVRTVDSCRFHEDPGDASSVEIVVEGFNLSIDICIARWSMKSTVHPVSDGDLRDETTLSSLVGVHSIERDVEHVCLDFTLKKPGVKLPDPNYTILNLSPVS